MTTKLTERSEWKALEAHYSAIKDTHLRDLFAEGDRSAGFTLKAEDLLLDYSKNRITAETMEKLVALAESADLKKWIDVGSSPRATIGLDRASRAHAWLQGRDHVTPEDVQAVAPDVLRHRIILSYEANADGVSTDDVIAEILKLVAVA